MRVQPPGFLDAVQLGDLAGGSELAVTKLREIIMGFTKERKSTIPKVGLDRWKNSS